MRATYRLLHLVAAVTVASLPLGAAPAAAQIHPYIGTVSFICLQAPSEDGRTARSLVAMFESSAERAPRPEPDEGCPSYLSRLMSTGSSANGKDEPPFPETPSCDALKDIEHSLLPPSPNEDYQNCLSFVLYGFW